MSSTFTPTPTYETAVTIPSDGDNEDAGSVSSPLEASLNNSAFNYANLAALGLSWHQEMQTISGLSGTTTSPPKWDPYSGRWLFSYNTQIYATTDGGVTFNAVGTAPNGGIGFICPPTTGEVFVWNGASSILLTPSTQTWTSVVGPTIGGTGPIFNGHYFNSLYVAVMSSTSTTTAFHSANGSTWTQAGSPFPSAVGNTDTANWFLADNGSSMLVAIPPGPAQTTYYSTPDGINWTAQTLPTMGGSESVINVDYDTIDSLFYMASSTSTTTRIFSSPDGINWTLKGTLSYPIVNFYTRGSVLVALATMQQSVQRVIFSLTGGSSWFTTQSPCMDHVFGLYKGGVNWMLWYSVFSGSTKVQTSVEVFDPKSIVH